MALSANRTDVLKVQDHASVEYAVRIKNSSVIYHGALLSCDTDTGNCKPYDGTQADRLLGWYFGSSQTGDTSASVPPEAQLLSGPFIWKNLTVGGLTGTYNTDIGKGVWATDDGTYTTLDPGGSGARVGFVSRPLTSSKCDVYFNNVAGYRDSLDIHPTPSPTPTPT